MTDKTELASSWGVGDAFVEEFWDEEAGDFGMIAEKSRIFLRNEDGTPAYGPEGQRLSRPLTVAEYIDLKEKIRSGEIDTGLAAEDALASGSAAEKKLDPPSD